MNTNRIIYWTTTGIVAAMMLFSGFLYLTSDEIKAAISTLGFPEFFRVELGVAKIVGALVLIIPIFPRLVREFAYFGFGLTFVSAALAHISIDDTLSATAVPVLLLGVLAVSYVYANKLELNLAK